MANLWETITLNFPTTAVTAHTCIFIQMLLRMAYATTTHGRAMVSPQ